jgi:flagellar basal-body rod modification protein FlgD
MVAALSSNNSINPNGGVNPAMAASSSAAISSAAGSAKGNSVSEMQDRFLKLLVAQINNQDPMNPMDNAQMTSQMAQINTVSGIQQVNQTLEGLANQFSAMQQLQAANLVGHTVLVPGNSMLVDPESRTAGAAFDLEGATTQVKIEILAPSGAVLDTLNQGALPAGRHSFTWDASQYGGDALNYRVSAASGKQGVNATTYSADRVLAVGSNNGALSIDLRGGQSVPYSGLAAIL